MIFSVFQPMAKIIVGIITIILLLLIVSPIATVGFYLITRPLVQPYSQLGYKLVGSFPIAGGMSLILALTAFGSKLWRDQYVLFTRQLLPLKLLLYFCCLSFINTPSLIDSVSHILKIFSGVSLYILVFNAVNRDQDVDLILWLYLISALIPMVYGYYQFITCTGHAWKGPSYTGRRVDSILMEYNAYGEYICINICAAMMLIFRKKRWKQRIIVSLIFISLLVSLILSLNRGSWICLLIAIIAAGMFYRQRINLALAFGICLVVLLMASPLIYERFMELTVTSEWGSKNTLEGRMGAWTALVPVIKKHPFIGGGVGAIVPITMRDLGYSLIPHNDYARLTAEAGIFSLLCYIWFYMEIILGNIMKNRYHLWQLGYPVLVASMYFATISFFQNTIQNVIVFPMFTGLVALVFKAKIIGSSTSFAGRKAYAIS